MFQSILLKNKKLKILISKELKLILIKKFLIEAILIGIFKCFKNMAQKILISNLLKILHLVTCINFDYIFYNDFKYYNQIGFILKYKNI